MTNTRELLEELSQSLDTEGLLRDLCGVGEIYENGSELSHSCKLPFGLHQNGDQNPSASLNKESLLFNCFTCGGGSIFWLVENILDISLEQAIVKVREYSTGSTITYEDFVEKLVNKLSTEKPNGRFDIPFYSPKILKHWTTTTGYMRDRGISEEVQIEMNTGLSENIEEWVSYGNAIQSVYLSRIIIPHFFNGKLVGWQGRKLSSDSRLPKYKNSKDFPKAWTLYNYDKLDSYDEVVIVESPMSVLKLKSEGIRNCVATFGASISDYQINLMRQFKHTCIWMDGDNAGRKATGRLTSKLSKTGELSIIDVDNEDPASVADPRYVLENERKNLLEWKLGLNGLKV